MNELKDRGVQDILIAVVDGLKGFPEAISAVFPRTRLQACVVHLIRNSLDLFVGPSATVPPHAARTGAPSPWH
jgi:transposase-like protein